MRRLSQKEKVLQYLKDFKSITTLECMFRLNIVDLQHAIMELRKDGYNIKDIWVQTEDNRYKRYFLEE